MTTAFIGVGSNIDPAANVPAGLRALRNRLGPLACSTVYETEAVGFDGPAFYNLVVRLDQPPELTALIAELRAVEEAFGRGGAAEQNGVPVRGCPSHILGADRAPRARLVFHNDRATEGARQLFGQQPCGDVHHTTRREGHQNSNHLAGKTLRHRHHGYTQAQHQNGHPSGYESHDQSFKIKMTIQATRLLSFYS